MGYYQDLYWGKQPETGRRICARERSKLDTHVQLGKCKLCLQHKVLMKSHFMPASLYDYCLTADSSPVKVGGGVILPTDRQTWVHLLCQECEDILSKGGESWIAGKLATWERTFPLYDILAEQPPAFDEDGMAVYFAASNPKIDVPKLTHFALGMFWKASVHPWSSRGTAPRIELGPYSESIRAWLRSDQKFPQYVYLMAFIERPVNAQITLNDPYEGNRGESRNFFLHVPGILFMLAVGKTVDPFMRWLCIHNNPENPISITDALTGEFVLELVRSVYSSRQTRAYLNSKAKIKR